jgi:long-chain acyl-CoA synthetase
MLSYTSGTTGDPKGVKLTHKMILGSAWAAMNHVSVAFSNEDSYISYLPAAHSFEQCL